MKRDDSGFTLIEMLLSVAILGIVMTAAAFSMSGAIKANSVALNNVRTTQTVVRDMNAAALYFPADVVGANGLSTAGDQGCGTPGADNLILNLSGQSVPGGSSAVVQTVVSYVWRLSAPGASTVELHRISCVGVAEPDDTTIAESLPLATPPTATCRNSSWVDTPGCTPGTVGAELTITFDSNGNVASLSGVKAASS